MPALLVHAILPDQEVIMIYSNQYSLGFCLHIKTINNVQNSSKL